MTTLLEALGPVAREDRGEVIVQPRTERELAHALMVLRERKAAFGSDAVLDRRSFDRLGTVADRSMTIEVGAGVLLRDVENVANHARLTLGVVPPSAWDLRVGELIEHPAFAFRAVIPGRLECLAARITGVTADGHLIRSPPGPRHAVGPDLASLLIGAGGRLGLITSAELRLLERPTIEQRRLFSFDRQTPCLESLREALSLGVEVARVVVRGRAGRTVMDVTLTGNDGVVKRGFELLDRCVERAGGRFEGQGKESEVDGAEVEGSWADVASALSIGASVELYRVSLASVVARGVTARSFTPEHPSSTALRRAFDAMSVLGRAR